MTEIRLKAMAVLPRMVHHHVGGVGPAARFEGVQNGWYVQIDALTTLILSDPPEFPLHLIIEAPDV